MILGMCLRTQALAVPGLADPAAKAVTTGRLQAELCAGNLVADPATRLACSPALPGRPGPPRLVAADQVPSQTEAGEVYWVDETAIKQDTAWVRDTLGGSPR